MPARVAVGFTQGQYDEASGAYRVKGENAHAWPEVYLAGSGWVRFEPTPSRGAPDDQAYTGLPPAQAAPGDGATSETIPTDTTAPGIGDTIPPDPGGLPTDIPEFIPPDVSTTSGAESSSDTTSVLDLLPLLAVLVGAVLLLAAAIPIAKGVRLRRRHAALRASARGRVDSAWEHAVGALGLLDVPVDPSATPREVAQRAANAVGSEAAPALAGLAEITTEARFGPVEPDETVQREAAGIADRFSDSVTRRVSWKRRLRRAFDPRPLFPRGETVNS
jgi:hypothetical protein